MTNHFRHEVAGNDEYDPIEIEVEIYDNPEHNAELGMRPIDFSIFIQQADTRDKAVISVEDWQLDGLIGKLAAVRAELTKRVQAHYGPPCGVNSPSVKLLNSRLARTPYLVLPKLAISVMPEEWHARFEALMQEMEDLGLETPSYQVLRDDGPGQPYTRCTVVNEDTGFLRITGGQPDPWANYKYGDVAELCPKWKGDE